MFAKVGTQTENIEVRLSYKIIELFSANMYASPNKAIEELVANSFDAGALRVQVLMSPNLHEQDATIVVIDDGEGMDASALKQHWLIGISNKRQLAVLPRGRQQIGQFGIGKLATYLLAERLTHVSKRNGRYYSASMDFGSIDKRVDREVEPKTPIKIPLRQLSEAQAKSALEQWTMTTSFKASDLNLFGKGAAPSWTVAIMSSLKQKVHELKPDFLKWVLSSALPLRPDFGIWLNSGKLISSKEGKGLLKKWIIGKDIVKLPRPAAKNVSAYEDMNVGESSEKRFGLDVPGLGRVTGYAEAYKDLLTGKSDEIGRSNGFFVYVFGRLVNVLDGHFGISPDELRHGTFGRFRLVVNMDSLDQEIRSNREAIREGPLLETAQNVLRAIFNFVRPTIETHDAEEAPGAKLARKFAASPTSLTRGPIIDLARAVTEGKQSSRYLIVPKYKSSVDRANFLASIEKRAADQFITGLVVDFSGSQEGGIAQYDPATGLLRINAWHPFVATFYDDFNSKGAGQPLQLLAMAEVLTEAHLYAIGVKREQAEAFLSLRDQLLRNLANESGRQSAFAVSIALKNARNNPDALERQLCVAFTSLGFEVTPIGGNGNPDGVAKAILSAKDGKARRYSVSLDAKSKVEDKGKVAAGTVKVATIIQHRDEYECQHALVVGRDFPTTKGDASSLAIQIDDDRRKTQALEDTGKGIRKTITLITIDDLADLVSLRPAKQVGLLKLRELFECRLPQETQNWVNGIRALKVAKPPYRAIVETIQLLHSKYNRAAVKYGELRVELSHRVPPIHYDTDDALIDLCKGMAQMAPHAIYAGPETIELDQSVDNVMAAIDAAAKDYLASEQH